MERRVTAAVVALARGTVAITAKPRTPARLAIEETRVSMKGKLLDRQRTVVAAAPVLATKVKIVK